MVCEFENFVTSLCRTENDVEVMIVAKRLRVNGSTDIPLWIQAATNVTTTLTLTKWSMVRMSTLEL